MLLSVPASVPIECHRVGTAAVPIVRVTRSQYQVPAPAAVRLRLSPADGALVPVPEAKFHRLVVTPLAAITLPKLTLNRVAAGPLSQADTVIAVAGVRKPLGLASRAVAAAPVRTD